MNFDKLTNYLNDEIYATKRIPGCDIMITKGYDVVYRGQFGYADLENNTPVSTDSQYYLYSCTKPVTVTGAMRLVEAGKIDLNTPAEYYLPELKDVFLEADGVRRAPKSKISLP